MPRSRYLFHYALVVAGCLLGIAWFLASEASIARSLGYPLDDAWIHIVYGESFSQGDFFSFNPGEKSSGSTSPLWVAVLGAVLALWDNVYLVPKALGVLFHVVASVAFYHLLLSLHLSRGVALIGAMLCATTTRLLWGSLSGMEVALYVALTVIGTLAHVKYRKDRSSRRFLSVAVFSIAGTARPECFALVPIVLLDQLLGRFIVPPERRGQAWDGRDFALAIAVFASVFLAYGGLNWSLSGAFFPITFYARVGESSFFTVLLHSSWKEIVDQVVVSPLKTFWPLLKTVYLLDNPFLALFVLVYLWVFLRRLFTGVRSDESTFFVLVFFLYPVFRSAVTGKYDYFFQYGRQVANLSPFYLVMGVQGLVAAKEYLVDKKRVSPQSLIILFSLCAWAVLLGYYRAKPFLGLGHQWPSWGWYSPVLRQGETFHVLLFGLFLFLACFVYLVGVRLKPERMTAMTLPFLLVVIGGYNLVEIPQVAREYAYNVKNIKEGQVTVGTWLRENSPDGSVVATCDAGAIRYFSGRKVIDTEGLVTPEVVSFYKQHGKHQGIFEYLLGEKPDYLVCYEAWYSQIITALRMLNLYRPVVSFRIRDNITCGGPGIQRLWLFEKVR
jgi:hypothetical protein